MTEAKKATDFSFLVYYDHDEDIVVPLSYYINAPASAKVNNDNVTISLGVPRNEYMETLVLGSSVTVTLSSAKAWSFDPDDPIFFTSDFKYYLFCVKEEESIACLGYMDRDVTIKGTRTWKAGR
jgi:hypothetical protein